MRVAEEDEDRAPGEHRQGERPPVLVRELECGRGLPGGEGERGGIDGRFDRGDPVAAPDGQGEQRDADHDEQREHGTTGDDRATVQGRRRLTVGHG